MTHVVSSHSFPPEIVRQVAAACFPGTLTCLARTHSMYQAEAERVLYYDLTYPSIACIETLSLNLKKATYVRRLTLGFGFQSIEESTAFEEIPHILVNMRLLNYLKVRYFDDDNYSEELLLFHKRLADVFRDAEFSQLHTFHCDKFILEDPVGFITNHPRLKLFVTDRLDPKEFQDLKEMERISPNTIPVIYVSGFNLHHGYTPHLEIFLGLYSPSRLSSILETLDRRWTHSTTESFREITIHLLDYSRDMYIFIKDISRRIPGAKMVIYLTFAFERQCKIPPGDVENIVAFFDELEELNFEWQNLDIPRTRAIGRQVCDNDRISQVQAFGKACPTLMDITFIDGERFSRATWEVNSEWIHL